MRRIIVLVSFAVFGWVGSVQAQPTPADLIRDMEWRNVGPANLGGRIVDIEALDNDFKFVILASASGGVFKSTNAGTTWRPIFDNYGVASIGDVAVFQPNPEILWVGTGEANNRNSVAWGDGIYKSTDGGETFANMGLESTHQIARVVTHPTDPDTVYVAAIGHLWGNSGDRGLFKTTDGGRTWRKLAGGLPNDGVTGCTELAMDPSDPNTLYTAFYHRLRQPYHFHSGGPNGGIFKSTDAGATWTKLTGGLPEGDTGRIGISIYRRDPRIVMAIVEHGVRGGDLSEPGSGIYRSEDAGATWSYVNNYNNRPFYYSQIRINPTDHQRVYILTTQFRQSSDGARTLRRGGDGIDGDFHAMWIDPNDGDRYYIGNDKGANLTHDHGRSFNFFDNVALGQFCAIGVDMRDPYYIYGGTQDNGSWGGPSFSRDARGVLTDSWWKLHWGDGSHAQIDPTDWRVVYTESENGSLRRYDALTRESRTIRPSAGNVVNMADYYPAAEGGRGGRGGRGGGGGAAFRFNWNTPLLMSPHDSGTVYYGGNHVFKTTDEGRSWRIISPDLTTNDPAKTRGGSGGLTPDNTGAETHCTTTCVSESAAQAGVIWATTDDGLVHVTRDGGATWMNARAAVRGVPGGVWASSVEASHFDPAVAYLTFDGHRNDDFTPWVFKTSDYGATWTNISSNIPDGQTIWLVREDIRNPNLLFIGTEFNCYFTIDGGRNWAPLMNGMPNVAVRDLVIHPRDRDLIAGTHGRSIFILDDISPLQQLTPEVMAKPAHLFEQQPATLWRNLSRGAQRGHQLFQGGNPPEIVPSGTLVRGGFNNSALIHYYLREPQAEVVFAIADADGANARTLTVEGRAGINRLRWDLRLGGGGRGARGEATGGRGERAGEQARGRRGRQARGGRGGGGPAAGPGVYNITMTVGGQSYTSAIEVREDPLEN